MKHLHERVSITTLPNPPHDVLAIWLKQTTNEAGFEIIYVAALRSVGVPARFDSNSHAEFWNGDKWQTAPNVVVENPQRDVTEGNYMAAAETSTILRFVASVPH